MPFANDFSICNSENCKQIGVSDSSGIFDSSTNSTGYRTTNLVEITRIQTTAQGLTITTVGSGEYFLIFTPQVNYHVWYNLDGAGLGPSISGSTAIEVALTTGDTAITVATITNAAINAFDFGTNPALTSTTVSDLITITSVQTGNTTNASTPTDTTGFTITTLQQGVWNDVAIADVTNAFIEYEVAGVTYVHLTFEADGTVDTTNDTIAIPAHGFGVRDAVIFVSENNPATLPGGLSEDTLYYIINVGANTIALATTAINATSNTRISLTSTGSDLVTVQGNVISVYPILPNVVGTIFTVDTDDLNYATSTEFPDGTYTIRYVVYGNGGGTDFTNEVIRDFLIYCQNQCCIHNLISKIPEADCKCDSIQVERALFALTMLEALKHAAQSGQNARAISINDTLTVLCSEKFCSSCL